MPFAIPRLRRATVAPAAALVLLLAAALPARAVDVQRVVSPGGIEAWLVEDHTNPVIALNIAFEGGSTTDPRGKEGLANMVSGLLDEGAGDLDSEAFRKQLEDLSISLSFDAGADIFHGQLETLTDNSDTAFRLLRLALTEPRFDAEPVQRVRSQILSILARNAKNPYRMAARRWWKEAFPNDPYGRPRDGTPETVKRITVDDMRGYVSRTIARDTLKIGVVGDITPKRLATVLDKVFGRLPAKSHRPAIANVKPELGGGISVIHRRQPQSVVIFGQAGVKRDDPRYYTAYVLNHILGSGSFTSRLMQEVRVKRGLAYSVASSLVPFAHTAVWSGELATRNERVAESIRLVRSQWERMRDKGITKKELEDAKTYLTGAFPLRLDSSDDIARILVAMQLNNLGIDYLDKRNGFIEAVTVEDVNRLAKTLLTPDRLTFVVVGEPKGLVTGKKEEGSKESKPVRSRGNEG